MTTWITDRPPTEADGDSDGDVAGLFRDGTRWLVVPWDEIGSGQPWMPFSSPDAAIIAPVDASQSACQFWEFPF